MLNPANSRATCIETILSKAMVLTEDPAAPAIKHKHTWRIRVGHVNGVTLNFEFPETLPTTDMVLKFQGEPTVIPVSRDALNRLSTATLREVRDCLVHTSYNTRKAGNRLHQELQDQGR